MRKRCLPRESVLALSLSALAGLGCSGIDPVGTTSTAGTGGASVLPGGGMSSVSGSSSTTTGGVQGTSGSGTSGSGTSGSAGVQGSSGQSTGGQSIGGQSVGGATSGGSGGSATSGAAGSGGGGGGGPVVTGKVRTGKSAGCDKPPPAADSSGKFILHEVHIAGLDPVYLTGGMYAQTSGAYDLSFRPYGVKLPANYNPATAYAVTFGGGGCGGSAQGFASGPNGGFGLAGNAPTIQVGLSYMGPCFNDGGPSIGNRPDSPEEPYFRAIMKEIEANYCIDLAQVFVGGYSSGGWESYTLGCAAADLVRGIGADEGGFRTMHPTCKGPVAAVLVAGTADTENPIGPLDPVTDKGTVDRLGSLGSAPGRDNILQRNGCVGTATEPYSDPKYSACVKYSGCPANYPVIWCALPGVGHNNSSIGNTNYSPGPMWDVLGKLPPP